MQVFIALKKMFALTELNSEIIGVMNEKGRIGANELVTWLLAY